MYRSFVDGPTTVSGPAAQHEVMAGSCGPDGFHTLPWSGDDEGGDALQLIVRALILILVCVTSM